MRPARLNARDARRVDEALASDPELARQYAVIREEYAETIHLNESLGRRRRAPCRSCLPRSTQSPRASRRFRSICRRGFPEYFASLSPRTLAWSASLGAVVQSSDKNLTT